MQPDITMGKPYEENVCMRTLRQLNMDEPFTSHTNGQASHYQGNQGRINPMGKQNRLNHH